MYILIINGYHMKTSEDALWVDGVILRALLE